MIHRVIICFSIITSTYSTDWVHKFHEQIDQLRFDSAINTLESADLQLSDRDRKGIEKLYAYYYFKKSVFEKSRNLLEQSSSSLDNALKFQPENLELLKFRAELHIASNQLEAARQCIELFLFKLNQVDRKYFSFQLFILLIKQEKLNQALQTIINLNLEYPSDTAILYELAKLRMKLEHYEDAAEAYSSLIHIDDKKQFREGLRRAKLGLNRQKRTIKSFSASFDIRIHGKEFDAYYPTIFKELEDCAIHLNNYFGFQPKNAVRIAFLQNDYFKKWNHSNNFVQGVSDGESWEIRISLNQVHNFENLQMLRNTIYHEYSHHIVRLITAGAGEIPLWFHEGLAKYLEPQVNKQNDRNLLKQLAMKNQLFEEGKIPQAFGMHSKSYEAYAQSASMVEYLQSIECLPYLISGLATFSEGRLFTDNLKDSCGLDEEQLVRQWKEWIRLQLN